MEIGEIKETLHERLLMEEPWVELDDIKDPEGDNVIWDFCTEVGAEDSKWLTQLYDLFTKGSMRTMNPVKNVTNTISFTKEDMPKVVTALARNPWLMSRLKEDIEKLPLERSLTIKSVLPPEILSKIER